jgi:hypothetical protein
LLLADSTLIRGLEGLAYYSILEPPILANSEIAEVGPALTDWLTAWEGVQSVPSALLDIAGPL